MSGLFVTMTFLALLIEALVGYPDRLVRAIGHPVTWMGRLIDWLDIRMNHADASDASRRTSGAVAVFILFGVSAIVGHIVERGLLALPLGIVWASLAASTLIAQRSLHQHVVRVADALEQGGLAAGRATVAHIVGRDPDTLDEAGVAAVCGAGHRRCHAVRSGCGGRGLAGGRPRCPASSLAQCRIS